jgi:putative ABC transport system ATP-binding protein
MSELDTSAYRTYQPYMFRHLRRLDLTKNYLFLSVVYGLSTLVIPFGVQMLVNNLALTGLWVSTFSFLMLIGGALAVTLIVKYGQVILVEFLQRHILNTELKNWFDDTDEHQFKTPYYFEMYSMLKSFASITAEGIDLLLTCFFGVLALTFIHPAFFVLSLVFLLLTYVIRMQGRGAIATSIEESNRKYYLFHSLYEKDFGPYADKALGYFDARNNHFGYIRRQAITVFFTYFILHIMLLAWGIHLIQINQLSLGQLVSAEIILSGMLTNYAKLPKLLESFYDFETSCYKLDYAKSKDH